MAESPPSADKTAEVTLHLMDSVTGAPLRTWRFTGTPTIRIGRGENNHVVIHDQQVSRVHAEINFESGAWVLANLGRNGTVLDGRLVDRAGIENQARFRLGPDGPSVQFLDHVEDSPAETTIMKAPIFAPPAEPRIDHGAKQRQVDEIADSDYFRELRKISQNLKNKA